jgi:dTDP-4-dehydrorhamnose reductase
MIGHKVAQVLEINNEVIGTSRKTISPTDLGINKATILNKDFIVDESLDFMSDIMPDVIINCVGITIRRINETNNNHLSFINSTLPKLINDWSIENSKKMIHMSTDCVFSGKNGYYLDDDKPDAADSYGSSKSRGEINNNTTLTLRSSMVGREIYNHTELFEWLIKNKNGKIEGYDNVIYSGITTIRMAKIIDFILNKNLNLSGIYNIGSIPISKYELLKMLNKAFNLEIDIRKITQIKSNKVLISKKFTEITGLKSPNWNDLISEFKEDCETYSYIYK